MAVILASVGRELRTKKKEEKKKKFVEMEQASSKKENPEGFLSKALEDLDS